MLRYLYANELPKYPKLADTMFCDRADQFKTRLGWDVTVDAAGHERDEYDDLNPLYVIWENADGTHGGSMRFLPTTGSVMVNDHFSELLGGGEVRSPLIWECTRFCLSRSADAKVAAALMLGGGEIMQGFDIEHFVGVFDARMVRIYRMIGSSPKYWVALELVAIASVSACGISTKHTSCKSRAVQGYRPPFHAFGSSAHLAPNTAPNLPK